MTDHPGCTISQLRCTQPDVRLSFAAFIYQWPLLVAGRQLSDATAPLLPLPGSR